MDVFRKQPVGSDDDVYFALLQAPRDFLLLFFRLKAREWLDGNGIAAHPPLKSSRMLLHEDRRRAQNGYLLARHRDAKRRPQGNFGLSEADVAPDQPIHKPVPLQMSIHFCD